jgi:hypothetical protein
MRRVRYRISWMRVGLAVTLAVGIALLALGSLAHAPAAGASNEQPTRPAQGGQPSTHWPAPFVVAGALTTPTASPAADASPTAQADSTTASDGSGNVPFLGVADSTWLMIGAGLWSLAAGLLVATIVALGKRRRAKRAVRRQAEEAQLAEDALSRIRSWH